MKVLILQDDEFEQVQRAIDDRHDAIEHGDISKEGKKKQDALKALEAAERACQDAADPKKVPAAAIRGNPVDGFTLVGPYRTMDEVLKSMENCQDDWWRMYLYNPDQET